jgi:hypothetical protein
MLRIFPLWMALLTPALGQLREVTIELRPTECVTCTESLPERMKRVRGVAGAEMQEAPAKAGRAVVSGQIAAPFEAIEVESVEVQP